MQSTGYLIKEAALQFMGQRTNVNYLKCISQKMYNTHKTIHSINQGYFEIYDKISMISS